MSETFKYLYLIWDLAGSNLEKNWVNKGGYIFTTGWLGNVTRERILSSRCLK